MVLDNNSSQPEETERFLNEVADILETVRKPFLILALDGTVMYANQRFTASFAISSQELLGSSLFEINGGDWNIPDLRLLFEVLVADAKEVESDYEIEHEFANLGRRLLKVNARCTSLSGLGVKVLLVSIEDYTVRRQQEKALRESEERFRRLFETSQDGLILVNKQSWRVSEVNPALMELLGVAREALVDKHIQEIGVIGEETDLQRLEQNLFGQGYVTFDQMLLNLKTAVSFPAQITFMNRSEAIQCNIRDITRHYLENTALRQRVSEWQTSFNAVPDLIWVVDSQLRIIRTNDAFNRYFGTSGDTLIGSYCWQTFGEKTECLLCPALTTRGTQRRHTETVYHQGMQRSFEVTSAPILAEDGQLLSTLMVARDLTEHLELERQLRQAQKMEAIGTLAGGIAHDFNNILTPIIGYAELSLDEVDKESPLHADLLEIHQAARRAMDLVRQILTFSRKREEEAKPLQVQHIVKEAIKLVRSTLPSSIKIEEEIDPECPPILVDPTNIHQVMMNLCTNAYHAMSGESGIISVSLSCIDIGPHDVIGKADLKAGPHVLLEVRDTGSGMSPGIVDKIFEPYFTTKGDGEGTGLGLAVVHGIVKSCQGAITVYSEPERGSVFRVYFPVAVDKTDRGDTECFTGSLPRGRERIMVVDDEPMIAKMEAKTLAGLGYQVTTFSDGTHALAAFAERPEEYDLVITDMTMPNLTGDRLASKMLELRPGLKIILCTGFSSLVDEKKARELGIRRYLVKPLLREKFAKVVRQVLDSP